MIGNAPHNRDELLVTGIPPVTEPLTRPGPEPGAETETTPVFVDATGWRARLGRRLGLLAGALLIVFLGALGLGMTTGTDVPLTPWSRPSASPKPKLSRPAVPSTGKRSAPHTTARPRPTTQAEAPAPTPSAAPKPTATASTTNRPGKSNASPPAWGRNKKDH
jgi:hypothetical protein